MGEIKININVKLDASTTLVNLLAPLIAKLAATSMAAEEVAKEPKAIAAEAPETIATAETIQEEPKAVEEPKATEEPATVKQCTEEDVRAAMHKTRLRIEGEDYKEHPESEGYKKWHRALNVEFKKIAAALGGEKPSTLPTADARIAFVNACEDLYVDNGELKTKCPF